MEYIVPEAASLLGVSVDTVRRRIRSGKLQARTSDGRLLVTLPDAQQPPADAQEVHSSLHSDAQQAASTAPEVVAVLAAQLEAREREIAQLHRLLQEAHQLALPAPAAPAAQGGPLRSPAVVAAAAVLALMLAAILGGVAVTLLTR